MQGRGESQGHKPGRVFRWWESGPGWCFQGGVREGPMGWAGSASQGQLAASTCPVR